MKKLSEEAMPLNQTERSPESSRRGSDLDRRYGRIGISAVAAALHSAPAETPAQSEESESRGKDERPA
jgi:hypothetical protein